MKPEDAGSSGYQKLGNEGAVVLPPEFGDPHPPVRGPDQYRQPGLWFRLARVGQGFPDHADEPACGRPEQFIHTRAQPVRHFIRRLRAVPGRVERRNRYQAGLSGTQCAVDTGDSVPPERIPRSSR